MGKQRGSKNTAYTLPIGLTSELCMHGEDSKEPTGSKTGISAAAHEVWSLNLIILKQLGEQLKLSTEIPERPHFRSKDYIPVLTESP